MARKQGTSPHKVLVAIRQLALLSSGGYMALPEMLALMRGLVGCDGINMFWTDAEGRVTDFSPSEPMQVGLAIDYVENFAAHEARQRVAGMLPRPYFQAGQLTYRSSASEHFDRRGLERSDIYNRILKRIGFGWGAGALCRRPDGVALGGLGVGRELRARDFSGRDVACLNEAQPWIEHLLRRNAEPAAREPYLADAATATLVLDVHGGILSASSGALLLLHQAADVPLRGGGDRKGEMSRLLRHFARTTDAVLHGRPASPPAMTIGNRWGRFHLRAYPLHAFETGSPMHVSLHIERQVPYSIGLFRSPRFLALSAREREVALHILAGRSHVESAAAMGVKPSTAIYFTRQLYAKLDISRQTDLLPTLLRAPDAALIN